VEAQPTCQVETREPASPHDGQPSTLELLGQAVGQPALLQPREQRPDPHREFPLWQRPRPTSSRWGPLPPPTVSPAKTHVRKEHK